MGLEKPRARVRDAAGTAAVALALWVGAGAAFAGSPIDERVDADAEGTVVIENLSGSVFVTGWDESAVEVKGTLGEEVEDLIVDRDGDEVTVRVVLPRRHRGDVEDTDLEIRVPRKSSLEIETVSASIEVENVLGFHDLESVSGSVEVEGEGAGLEAECVSGSIEVRGKIPRVDVESVSGRITLEGTEGRVEASTTSGKIEIVGGAFDRVSCESVSGRIFFEGNPTKDAEFRIENVSGSVTLELPKNLSAEVDVETFSGDIDTDLDGRVRRSRHGPGASLHETYGDGDASFTIETFSGSVRIREK
jgi:DUF4097 and DUF4098 domain-containing protein YvlB